MRPYYSAIIRGVSSFMVSYSSWNGVKTHANKFLITDYLKNSLKFRVSCCSLKLNLKLFKYELHILRNTNVVHFANRVLLFPTGKESIGSLTPPHANYSSSIAAGIGAGIDMDN